MTTLGAMRHRRHGNAFQMPASCAQSHDSHRQHASPSMPTSSLASKATPFASAIPLLFVVLWSTGFIGARLGLPDCEPLTLLSLRYGAVLALMGAIALATRAPWPASGAQWLH